MTAGITAFIIIITTTSTANSYISPVRECLIVVGEICTHRRNQPRQGRLEDEDVQADESVSWGDA